MRFVLCKVRTWFAGEFIVCLILSALLYQSKAIDTGGLLKYICALMISAVFWFIAYRKKWDHWIPAEPFCIYLFLSIAAEEFSQLLTGHSPDMMMLLLDAGMTAAAYFLLKYHYGKQN